MQSAGQYQDQINQILGIKIEEGESHQWDYETLPEAEKALSDMQASINELTEMRRDLNADMKAIRDDYRDKMANAAAGSSTAMNFLGRKQKAGQIKADAKRQLRSKRNETLAPYNEVKSSLDKIIPDLEKQSAQAQRFIDSGQGSPLQEPAEPEKRSAALATFYLATPPAGSQLELEPMPFTALKPIEPPQEFIFDQPQPAAPEIKEAGLRGIFSGSRRQQIEEENRQMQSAYEKQLQAWNEARETAGATYALEKEAYQSVMADWIARKETFDTAEIERVRQLEEARLNDPSTMRALLGRRLDHLLWPPELDMTYACEYTIERGGEQIYLEVRLPEQNDWSESLVSYSKTVQAIVFRLAGELFFVLPRTNQVTVSAFDEGSGLSSRLDGYAFLLSSKINRDDWQRIDFDNLEQLDLGAFFSSVETRIKITEAGRLLPVDRFRR